MSTLKRLGVVKNVCARLPSVPGRGFCRIVPAAERAIHQAVGVFQQGPAAAERQVIDAVALEGVSAVEGHDPLVEAAVLGIAIVVVVSLSAAQLAFAESLAPRVIALIHPTPG